MADWFISVLILIGLTMLPFLELRASIPYGVLATDIPVAQVFVICVLANIALAPLLWLFVNYVMHLFLKIKFIDRIYQRIVTRTQKRVQPYVEKYGLLGLSLFIGVPLPGSGVYSGALGAYLLGYDFKNYLRAAVVGVLIAGIVVTLISVSGNSAFDFMIKRV